MLLEPLAAGLDFFARTTSSGTRRAGRSSWTPGNSPRRAAMISPLETLDLIALQTRRARQRRLEANGPRGNEPRWGCWSPASAGSERMDCQHHPLHKFEMGAGSASLHSVAGQSSRLPVGGRPYRVKHGGYGPRPRGSSGRARAPLLRRGGLSIAEIARRLGRAEATVKAYLYDPSDANKRPSRTNRAVGKGDLVPSQRDLPIARRSDSGQRGRWRRGWCFGALATSGHRAHRVGLGALAGRVRAFAQPGVRARRTSDARHVMIAGVVRTHTARRCCRFSMQHRRGDHATALATPAGGRSTSCSRSLPRRARFANQPVGRPRL